MSTPVPLPPAIPDLDVTVERVESLRPGLEVSLDGGGMVCGFREVLEGDAGVMLRLTDGSPVLMGSEGFAYLGGWLDEIGLRHVPKAAATRAGLPVEAVPEGVRCRDTSFERIFFNYGCKVAEIHGQQLAPAGVLRESRNS